MGTEIPGEDRIENLPNEESLERIPTEGLAESGKKLSGHKLRRYDSLDIESAKLSNHHGHSSNQAGQEWSVILQLAFQSLGIVYGDIGTSPLYVYSSTFTKGIKHNDDILGVLSLIFYTITLIPLIKYVFIVLRANDNGNGGTFALYSLICRYARVGLIPSQQAEDQDVSNFQLELPSNRLSRASRLKSKLESSRFAKFFLLFATMLGTSMVIGDGVLTPCISVLSAVGGIKEATSAMTEDKIVWISVSILVCLFMVQRLGTDKVGYSFAPIICIWFTLIGTIGAYNFFKFDPGVIRAINPMYIVDYFRRNGKDGWISLGGIVLAITGTEALFADVGHFTVRSIQISMCCVTYPALLLAYTGQASFLRSHNDLVSDTFFKSIPGPLYWPMFVAAVLASIIASQAMISGTFSIIQQSLSLGCFPLVKIVHTSTKYEGQVYIPEINYLLMLACVCVTLGFRTTEKIGNAYGIAVVFVMTLTSSFLVLIMVMIWKTHILLVISYVVVIGSVEFLYLSSVLYKFYQGGYLPLAFAVFLMTIMYVWNSVYRRKYYYELDHKISPEKVKEIAAETNVCRIPGLAVFYSELVHGIPPIFKHYVENVPSLHSVVVFVSIKSLPIGKVPVEERFLFQNPCIVRAEQPLAPDLPFDRTFSRSGGGGPRSSTRRRDLVFVVNPRGANGRTGQEWKKLLPYLRSRLGRDCNICESLTSGPSHAIDITREAIQEGADAVVAVGGDGTLHEVINGFFWAGKPVSSHDREDHHSTALGLIPLGTGSDFARTFGWKNDPREAIERIAKGVRSPIDVGVIGGETEEFHYFINVADIHLSAKAGFYASRYKRFGNLCYVIGALQAFIGHSNQDIRIKINDGEWETFTQVTALCIGNAKFFGGGMKITPNADPRSGSFEVVILRDFKWYDFILKLHRLYNGTHLSVKNVYSRRVQSIEVEDISGGGSIYVQSDGEHLGFLPRKFRILPSAVDMIC